MRKLILSLLVVASLGACSNEQSEVGRYQFILRETTVGYDNSVFDTKTGELFTIGQMADLTVLNFPKGTIKRKEVYRDTTK
jgi:hypothetical protein